MKTIQLRDYQENILKKLDDEFSSGQKEVVLAACPSSGKTTMMLSLMQNKTSSTFLVLTHATTVLRDQWGYEFASHDMPASTSLNRERITYGIPQSLHNKELASVDYLVIDEAHQYTKAQMVSEIISKVKAKYIIYLTGTPSSFIKDNKRVLSIPAMDLIKQGFISDVYVGMVTTNANLQNKDYNTDGEVINSKLKKLEDCAEADIFNLLKAMHKRLCETNAFKGNPKLRNFTEWLPSLGKLDKTMIACRSVAQADKVTEYFTKTGVSVISSHSKNDKDSLNIKAFQDSADIKILVVVDRGILGFNMPDLVNVVDLTCSRNIDRIYQLYARVMRKNDKYPKKYFFKFSDELNMKLNQFYMDASLCLLLPEFINNYNGKNLNEMNMPVKITKQKIKGGKRKVTGKTGGGSVRIDPLFYDQVTACKMLTNIWNIIERGTNEYAFVTFGEIRNREFGYKIDNATSNKKLLIRKMLSGEPKIGTKHDLYDSLQSYVCSSNGSYDKNFDEIYRKYWAPKAVDEHVRQLLEWAKTNEYHPKASSTDKTERLLSAKFSSYTSPNSNSYNLELVAELTRIRPSWFLSGAEKLKLKSFNKMMSKIPDFVKYKQPQIWKGSKRKHIFIDKYGEFEAIPSVVMNASWPKGNSGNRLNIAEKFKQKPKCIKNIDTNMNYPSITEAANSINLSSSSIIGSIKRMGTAGGYRWAYCDENGNIIK